ncbi:hypothetical protein V5799_004729 [Amblyomma americanum]|uniref:Uncharacterized protein n=1 Tax=Amblyomma americanum TaxID=6943 RepID=A0AAQ4D5A0_AMBAM
MFVSVQKTPLNVSYRLVGFSDLIPTGEALDDAYSSFADMRTDAFLDNWLRALDGRRSTSWPGRAAVGLSYLARLVDAPFFDMGREWLPQLSPRGARGANGNRLRQLLVVRPHHVIFPMFGDNVTTAIR